ncbi:hypothetical protein M2163_001218 [Streptomyces sp. SAI-135]|nr:MULTISPECIES: hypothetical protein [unclassified Streptomyces]MDH6521789.1 hypothetical protein [Streptomyces sp. SAI-090]MDH6614110.1 hypothetical protein [Streptomyces sp. SAI-135]
MVQLEQHRRVEDLVKATADGFYRYSFPGTTTTRAVSAAGDYGDYGDVT